MNPRVTVLMPMFDGARHVRAAIDSVLGQTFEDFELLVVDDASHDDSVAVVESYDDSRIRLLRNERNLGQVATTNRGLREASGEYVARLDQDDVCLPTRLERQVAVLDAEQQVAVVGSFVDVMDSDGNVKGMSKTTIDDFAEFLYLLLVNRLPLAHSAVTYRRAEVVELGGYDETYRLVEDSDLWRRLALRRREARMVPTALLRYLVHEGQQSKTRGEEQRANNKRSYMRFVEALAESDVGETAWQLDTLEISLPEDVAVFQTALDRIVAGAAAHLGLSESERAKLERSIRRFVYRAARRSWRAGLRHFRRAAPALARYGTATDPTAVRLARLAVFRSVYIAAPALEAARRVKNHAKRRRYHGSHD